MLRILYLVHDLSEPAVRRRVAMLEAGGAQVTLAGFRRGDKANDDFGALGPIELGRTSDGKFAQRLAAVAKAALSLGAKFRAVAKPDIIIGRNLEMLALANRANTLFGGDVPIVYECLDIHRLLLGRGAVGKAMRSAERMLGRNTTLLMTSSPAFLREYFAAFRSVERAGGIAAEQGAGTCRQFLPLSPNSQLCRTTTNPGRSAGSALCVAASRCGCFQISRGRQDGRFEIVLRGRPAYSEFDDFDGFVAAEPHMHFAGPYRNPEDLAAIYGEVHFSWAIDFFEEGLNSSWLLPNRLYEGCRYGAVPIAMRHTETGRFLADRHLGLLLDDPSAEGLAALLGGIEMDDYATPETANRAAGSRRMGLRRGRLPRTRRSPAEPRGFSPRECRWWRRRHEARQYHESRNHRAVQTKHGGDPVPQRGKAYRRPARPTHRGGKAARHDDRRCRRRQHRRYAWKSSTKSPSPSRAWN